MSNEHLMRQVANGDGQAYAVLVARHGDKYLGFAVQFLGHRAEAEDALQDAFLKLWSKADSFEPGKASFTTWFYRVLLNRCLDMKRKLKPVSLPDGYDAVDQRAGADENLHQKNRNREVRKALDGLPEKQCAAVALCYYQGLSNRDAAEILRVNVKALESLLVRARGNLRKILINQKAVLLDPL